MMRALLAAGVLLVVWAFVLGACVGRVTAPAVPAWDYNPERVRAAITQELTDALCPPYSELNFTEDGSYGCFPG